MPEVDVLGQVVPAISAAVGAYGVGVLTRAEDAAADGTVRLGQRLLGRILRHGPAPEVDQAVRALADAAPDEAEDAQASRSRQIHDHVGAPHRTGLVVGGTIMRTHRDSQ